MPVAEDYVIEPLDGDRSPGHLRGDRVLLVRAGTRWGVAVSPGTLEAARWILGRQRQFKLVGAETSPSNLGLVTDNTFWPIALMVEANVGVMLPDGAAGFLLVPGCFPARYGPLGAETAMMVRVQRCARVVGSVVHRGPPSCVEMLSGAADGWIGSAHPDRTGAFEVFPAPAGSGRIRIRVADQVLWERDIDIRPGDNDVGPIRLTVPRRFRVHLAPDEAWQTATAVTVQIVPGGFAARDTRNGQWPVRRAKLAGGSAILEPGPWGEVVGYLWTDAGWSGQFPPIVVPIDSEETTMTCVLDPPGELELVWEGAALQTEEKLDVVILDGRCGGLTPACFDEPGWLERAGGTRWEDLQADTPAIARHRVHAGRVLCGIAGELGLFLGATPAEVPAGGRARVGVGSNLRSLRIENGAGHDRALHVRRKGTTAWGTIRVGAGHTRTVVLDRDEFEILVLDGSAGGVRHVDLREVAGSTLQLP
jgi:hypothetical protein